MKFISLVSCLILTSTYSSAQRIETGKPKRGKIVHVKTKRPLSVKDRVAVVIKDVLKMDDRILIRFSVQNRGPEIYEVRSPRVTAMTEPKSQRSLVPVSLTQLSEKDAERIRRNG